MEYRSRGGSRSVLPTGAAVVVDYRDHMTNIAQQNKVDIT